MNQLSLKNIVEQEREQKVATCSTMKPRLRLEEEEPKGIVGRLLADNGLRLF
jgi:hypothetical protein